jgi:hypothetical protein
VAITPALIEDLEFIEYPMSRNPSLVCVLFTLPDVKPDDLPHDLTNFHMLCIPSRSNPSIGVFTVSLPDLPRRLLALRDVKTDLAPKVWEE